jgi:hypothetical protein
VSNIIFGDFHLPRLSFPCTTNSTRSTRCPAYRFSIATYRAASACSSRFHPASGTSTFNTASANSTARVRSATADPQTKGHASIGASPGATRRKEFTTIFSNPEPACSKQILA